MSWSLSWSWKSAGRREMARACGGALWEETSVGCGEAWSLPVFGDRKFVASILVPSPSMIPTCCCSEGGTCCSPRHCSWKSWEHWRAEGRFCCNSLCLCLEKQAQQGVGSYSSCWVLNPAVSCGTAPVRKAGMGQGCGAAASGAGQRRVGGSNPARAGSIPGHYCRVTGYGACSGGGKERCGRSAMGRVGLWGTSWEAWPRKNEGICWLWREATSHTLFSPPSKMCVSLGIVPALSTTVGSKSNLQVYN